jgi:WD40 repeat protein
MWNLDEASPPSDVLPGIAETGARSVAFSPDGRLLAVGEDGGVSLIETTSRQRIAELPAAAGGNVSFVVFSPDGTMLAIGGSGDGVILVDVATQQQIGTLAGHGGDVWPVRFSPDGRHLVAYGWVLLLWDIDPNHWEAMACSLASRNLTFEEWAQFLGGEPYRKTCPDLPGPDESAAMTAPLWATPWPSSGATPVPAGSL